MKKAVATHAAPSAIGPYSQAIVHGDLIFCSGQIGIDPASGKMVEGGVETETRRVLENLREVLIAAGVGFAQVVKTTVFLVSLASLEPVTQTPADLFDPPSRARPPVRVPPLPRQARVKMEAFARR